MLSMQAASSFAAQLNTAHDSACPWRGNRCERDLVSFPALSAPAMLRVWQSNLHSLSGLSCLPNLDSTDAQKLINANRCSSVLTCICTIVFGMPCACMPQNMVA